MSLIDPARSAHLCDVGQRDYLLVTAIGDDGETDIVLAEKASIGDETVTYNPRCPDAPHEQLGELPPRWKARIQLAPFYCGHPTKRGKPCRVLVSWPGRACTWHRR